jgi:hypothetical protein
MNPRQVLNFLYVFYPELYMQSSSEDSIDLNNTHAKNYLQFILLSIW